MKVFPFEIWNKTKISITTTFFQRYIGGYGQHSEERKGIRLEKETKLPLFIDDRIVYRGIKK